MPRTGGHRPQDRFSSGIPAVPYLHALLSAALQRVRVRGTSGFRPRGPGGHLWLVGGRGAGVDVPHVEICVADSNGSALLLTRCFRLLVFQLVLLLFVFLYVLESCSFCAAGSRLRGSTTCSKVRIFFSCCRVFAGLCNHPIVEVWFSAHCEIGLCMNNFKPILFMERFENPDGHLVGL